MTPARAAKILDILETAHPEAECALHHQGAFQLVVATILSAQCTDQRVNLVTPALFARYPTPAALAEAQASELEETIRSTGFFRSKAKSLIGCARALVADHAGQVPGTIAAMIRLPGVGRKTANVILNVAFGHPTIAVDTHIFRVSNRSRIAPGKNVLEVERKLLKFVPAEYKLEAHHLLILHGRYTCIARKPRCGSCVIEDLCEYRHKIIDQGS